MIGIKIRKPKRCIFCPVRFDCKIYIKWLNNRHEIDPDKKMFSSECLLVDFERFEDDLK